MENAAANCTPPEPDAPRFCSLAAALEARTRRARRVQQPHRHDVHGHRPGGRATQSPRTQTAVSCARYGERMEERGIEERRIIDLDIRLDGMPSNSETTAMWPGPDVLTIATVLPDHGVVFDLHKARTKTHLRC
jgi:hypothetical protein